MADKDENFEFNSFNHESDDDRAFVNELPEKDKNLKKDNFYQEPDDRNSGSELAAKDQNSQFYEFYLKPNRELQNMI